MRLLRFIFSLACLVSLILLPACSTKKNTPASRNWQAFTTRYNVYYNGKTHFDEQLKEMERKYEDDYTRTLLIHPAEARADAKLPQPSGDFKRSIEKMQKAIQLHSIKKKPAKKGSSPKEKEFRAREEFNPFLHNAWLTLGKSQYLSGDFLGAASTFFYISKHFKWLPAVITEARLWMALSYCALDWDYEAESALHLVKEKDLSNNNLRNLYNLANADYNVRTNHYREALPFLRNAAKSASGSQKNRLWFLLGQVYSNLGEKKNAYQAFKRAGSGVSTDYRAKFNARIKQSEVFEGGNIKGEVRSLKAMARYARNSEFLDQIYYAIGNLYLSRKDTLNALENYRIATEKSTRNGIDKAMALLALGNIYFAQSEYVKAQPCYSEAVPQLPDNFPDIKMLRRRSDVLDELALYAGNVNLQDSLLDLSKLSEEEQMKVCERLARELVEKEKREAAEAEREKYLAEMEAKGQAGINRNDAAPSGFVNNSDKSWYFYNTMTKNQGKNEFQRRWGARKLEDDWRRRNKTSFSLDEPLDSEEEEEENDLPADSLAAPLDEKKLAEAQDPHNAAYYFAQIPRSPEEIQTANDVIQEGLYNMGVILKDKLEDFPAAKKEFDRLLQRYPDNIYRLDVYYNLYLMAVRTGNKAAADRWRDLIIAQFPDSPYGQAMRDPDYFDNLRRMHQVQEEIYSNAFNAYLADDNAAVHRYASRMEEEFPLSPIMPKFVFIDALSYLTEDQPDKFRERVELLLRKWPDTDMTDMAGGIMRGLQAGRKPHAGISNSRGMIWTMRLSNDSVPMAPDGQPANFERNPDAPQYFVLAFPRDSVSANGLLFDVARFNFSSFVVRDFDLEPMSFGNVGLLIIKGFDNMRQLEHYRAVMAEKNFVLPDGVRPIMISKANFELLLREGRSFEEYFRFEEEDALEEAERILEEAEESADGEDEDLPESSPRSESDPESDPESDASDLPDESALIPPLSPNEALPQEQSPESREIEEIIGEEAE